MPKITVDVHPHVCLHVVCVDLYRLPLPTCSFNSAKQTHKSYQQLCHLKNCNSLSTYKTQIKWPINVGHCQWRKHKYSWSSPETLAHTLWSLYIDPISPLWHLCYYLPRWYRGGIISSCHPATGTFILKVWRYRGENIAKWHGNIKRPFDM